jgi:hypothetical protein
MKQIFNYNEFIEKCKDKNFLLEYKYKCICEIIYKNDIPIKIIIYD